MFGQTQTDLNRFDEKPAIHNHYETIANQNEKAEMDREINKVKF